MSGVRKRTRHAPLAPDAWMSTLQAERVLGKARATLLTWALKGELEAKHEAGRTLFTRESVERKRAELDAARAAA